MKRHRMDTSLNIPATAARPATRWHDLNRRLVGPGAVLLVALFAASGCKTSSTAPTSVRDRLSSYEGPEEDAVVESSTAAESSTPDTTADAPTASETEQAPTPRPQPTGRPIALVNGEAIPRQELINLLIETRGLQYLQQLILAHLAEQEARKLGVKVSDADIEREYAINLEADRFNGKDKSILTPERKEQLIADWLRSRDVTRAELDIAMHRQAYLRKITQQRVSISEDMLRQEYKIKSGEKAEVRHLQLSAPRSWPNIKPRLDRGEDFETIVREYSINAVTKETGGLMPPISREDPSIPSVFSEIAFSLKPGEVSAMFEAEGSYHVLKLERILPGSGGAYESMKPELEKVVRERLVSNEMQRLGEQLLMRSKLEISDPTLKKQYNERLARREIIGPPIR